MCKHVERKAFTLVELLVVIAIIGILVWTVVACGPKPRVKRLVACNVLTI